jgi:hypothetical protein
MFSFTQYTPEIRTYMQNMVKQNKIMIHEYSPVEEEVGDQRRPGKRGGGP